MKAKRVKARGGFRVGPGGALYTIVTILILAVAIYGQTNLLFWSFGLMVGGLVVSALLSWWMLRRVTVERLLPAHGVVGEAMVLRYSIQNRKRWMPAFGLVVHETWGKGSRGWRRSGPVAERPRRLGGRPYGWVLHVGPHQSVLTDAVCWPMRRGMLSFERIVISTSFPFGVVRRTVEFEQRGTVLVYPELFRMNRRTLHRLTEAVALAQKQRDRGGGSEEFFGLREYRPGDSLKMIDWKRTARTGELVTREMTQASPPRIMISLDLSDLPPAPELVPASTKKSVDASAPDAWVDAERAVSLAASLVCDAHLNGYQSGLMVEGVRCMAFPIHHSLPHRTRMLESLAALDFSVRNDAKTQIVTQPTVVIRPGRSGSAPRSMGGPVILGAGQIEEYVSGLEGDSSAILTARSGLVSRRQRIQEDHE